MQSLLLLCKALIEWTTIASVLFGSLTVLFSYLAYKLSRKIRKDQLWEKRYEFFINAEKLWKESAPEDKGGTRILEMDDLEYMAVKAEFLFGRDISTHIRSYAGKTYSGDLPWIPDEEFLEPFKKYLKIGD